MRIVGVTSLAKNVTRFLDIPHLDSFMSEEQSSNTSSDDIEIDFFDVGELISCQNVNIDDQSHSLEMNSDEDNEEKDQSRIIEKNRSFWASQHLGVQTNIYKTSSWETKIRSATMEAIQEIERAGTVCVCNRNMSGTTCRNCLMREVSMRLQKAGFNCAICKTKWRTSSYIPSGDHTFLDVLENTNPKKGEVRVMIELNFQAEFKMARGSDEYNKLIEKLPEVFVGKVERLSNLIEILCKAAKKCMKDKKLHMGPWRKHRYMQAKWLGPCERNTSTTPLPMGYFERIITKQKSKVSLLTIELLEKLPTLHCAAVEGL